MTMQRAGLRAWVWSVSMLAGGATAPMAAAVSEAAGRAESAVMRDAFDTRDGSVTLRRTGRLLVKLAGPARGAGAETGLVVIGRIDELGVLVVGVPGGRDERVYERELMGQGRFAWVMPDWLASPCGKAPDDPLFAQQWQLDKLNCMQAWEHTTGNSVVCAFVDTGVELTHPDLAARLVPGYNVPSRLPQSAGGRVDDIHGHGTATAGSACATGNNGIGGSGVGWDLKLMPVRATNSPGGSAFFSDIISGVVWAAQNGARVVSVSYAGASSPVVQDMGVYCRSLNALLVWAADNTGLDYGPGWDHADVIVVGGTDAADERYSGSAYGRPIDVAAPARDVLVPSRGGGYGLWSGNSFAAPMTAAAAALVWSVNPALTPAQVEDYLERFCDDIGAPGEDPVFGHGRVNAGRAVAAARADLSPGSDPATPGGGLGSVYLPAIQPSAQLRLGPGLRSSFFDTPVISMLPDLSLMAPVEEGIASVISMPSGTGPWPGTTRTDRYAAVYEGYFEAPSRAAYVFMLESDDGSRLLIDDREVVNNDGVHLMTEAAGTVYLEAGLHTIRIEFFDATAEQGLVATVRGGGLFRRVLDDSLLRFAADAVDFNLDGLVNVQDLLDFLSAYDELDPRADFNADGLVEFADYLMFIDEYLRKAL